MVRGVIAWLRATFADAIREPGFSEEQIRRIHRLYVVVMPLWFATGALTAFALHEVDAQHAQLFVVQAGMCALSMVGLMLFPARAHRIVQLTAFAVLIGVILRLPESARAFERGDIHMRGVVTSLAALIVVVHTAFAPDVARRLNVVAMGACALTSLISYFIAGKYSVEAAVPMFRMVTMSSIMVALTRFMNDLQVQNTRLETERRMMEQLALTDPLTQLSNRRAFDGILAREVARAARHHLPLSVLLIDVDFFKRVNDTRGHTVGDAVLVLIARVLRETLRTSDEPARWAGDELAAVLPMTTRAEASIVAERIREAIERTNFQAIGAPSVTVTVGIASLEGQSDTLGSILERADAALYNAKHHGRNAIATTTSAHRRNSLLN